MNNTLSMVSIALRDKPNLLRILEQQSKAFASAVRTEVPAAVIPALPRFASQSIWLCIEFHG